MIVFVKEFFEKANFEKKSADNIKSLKIYQACTLILFSHGLVQIFVYFAQKPLMMGLSFR